MEFQHDFYDDIFPVFPPIPRRNLSDAQDPFALDVEVFKNKYRFTQDIVKNKLVPLIQPNVDLDQRGLPLSTEIQMLICLRFYATASFQAVCGDLHFVSQPSVSRIVMRVSKILASQCHLFIKYPTDMGQNNIEFERMGRVGPWPGINGIDGAIDCTHIRIVNTPGVVHHEAYRNRKSYFSINVQAVTGPNGRFMDLVARWAGSTHDSRIFQMSRLKYKYTQGIHTGILIGDNGYPSLPYLITPVNPTATPAAEERYNRAHKKTRNIVERAFGMWKRRFPCLSKGMGNKLETVSNIIIACGILFNISLDIRDQWEYDQLEEANDANEPLEEQGGQEDGFAVRANIINRFV